MKGSQNRVDWLRHLLESYPGSRWGNRETRGLDTQFAKRTYVATELERTLLDEIRARTVRLVVLCGNAGDGKTALLQQLARELGLNPKHSAERIFDGVVQDGLRVRMNLDGSAAWKGRSADELLDEFLEPFQQGAPREDIVHLLAINDGRLLEWIERGPQTPLKQALADRMEDEAKMSAHPHPHLHFYNLNERSHVGGVSGDRSRIETHFLERLLDRLYGGAEAKEIWEPCITCSAQESCGVYGATKVFGPEGLPNSAAAKVRTRARERLFEALQAVHFRGKTHITIRELRGALVYILFGTHFCQDYHEETHAREADEAPVPYWDRAFSPKAPDRQGEVLAELVRLDPALEAHPKIDRKLLHTLKMEDRENPARLGSARRRAYFEWTEEEIKEAGGKGPASATEGAVGLGLARGRHLHRFRNLPLLDETDIRHLCADLCRGLAHLGDLPTQALDRTEVVPLRISPQTPTETAFWSEKSFDRFRLETELAPPPPDDGRLSPGLIERLHRQAFLIYRYTDGREERLRLGANLFHHLLELGEGVQLGDVSTDGTFANVSSFLQRLVREDDRELRAWNPINEGVYDLAATIDYVSGKPRQRLLIRAVTGAEEWVE